MYAQLYHRIKRIIAVRHNKTRKLNVYGVFEGSKPVYGNHVALQAGIEPASTVPETAILSVRLLEQFSRLLYFIFFRLVSRSPVVIKDLKKSYDLLYRLILLYGRRLEEHVRHCAGRVDGNARTIETVTHQSA